MFKVRFFITALISFITIILISSVFNSNLVNATNSFNPCQSSSHSRLIKLSSSDGLPKEVQDALTAARAEIQPMTKGAGDYVYDEYRITVDEMPSGTTPEAFLNEMLQDLNGTVNDPEFNEVNEFQRRRSGKPQLGEIIDIDIYGPDNGSVVLSEQTDSYFIFTTVKTPEKGTHPEHGSREFGFERNPDGSITFYTRGASRPEYQFTGRVGRSFQRRSWTSLMRGIGNTIKSRGGRTRSDSFQETRHALPNSSDCKMVP